MKSRFHNALIIFREQALSLIVFHFLIFLYLEMRSRLIQVFFVEAKYFVGTAVYLSLDGFEVGNCESPSTEGRSGEWYDFYCDPTEANQITIHHPTYYTIFCEVDIVVRS